MSCQIRVSDLYVDKASTILSAAEGAKVIVEQALHQLQLDMRAQVEKYEQLQEARRYFFDSA